MNESLDKIPTGIVKQNIRKINDIELRAKKLQQKLDALRNQWDDSYDIVQNTDEWKQRCNHYGVSHRYNFYDILA